MEESAQAGQDGDASRALEQAKEAGKKERQLSRMREQNGFQDQQNIDLTYAIIFNLAGKEGEGGTHKVSTVCSFRAFTASVFISSMPLLQL